MHFRHHSTSDNTETFVQDPPREDIPPIDASQARVINQDASHLHRKLSEKIHGVHEKLKAHTDHRLVLSEGWQKECAEVARKHKEKHDHHLHHEASLTSILAGSAAAAGYSGTAVHANKFPIVRDDQHEYTSPAYNAPGYDAPAYTQDRSPQAFAAHPYQPMARVGSQENGITTGYDDDCEPQTPVPRSTARELADESLGFMPRPSLNSDHFPQATQRSQPTQTRQPERLSPTSSYPNCDPTDSLPAQLQIRPKASTPPYPSKQAISFQPCTAEFTIKSTPQIVDIIRQLQIEGFFHPSNVAFLPSQLEMMLRKQGIISAMEGADNGTGVQVPGCMPDARGFGGEGEEAGSKDLGEDEAGAGDEEGGERSGDEGYESADDVESGEHDDKHEEDSEDEEHREGDEAGESAGEEHGEESEGEQGEGEYDDESAEGEE